MKEQKKNLLVLCGKSSSGKDTILKELKNYFKPCVSHTTRPKRPHEIDGEDYYFITDQEFKKMFDDEYFLETRTYFTIEEGEDTVWKYGLSKDEVLKSEDNNLITILDVKGFKEFWTNVNNNDIPIKICLIYIKCKDSVRRIRAMNRPGYEKEEFDRRMADDEFEFMGVDKIANFTLENELLTPKEASNIILKAIILKAVSGE